MAKLAKCKSCEKEVSKQAATCPNCGAPLKKSKAGINFLFIVGAGIAVGFMIVNSQEKSAADKVVKAKQITEMPISDISWNQIDNSFGVSSKLTDLQKDEEWKKYAGKKVQLTGKVNTIDEGIGGGLYMTIKMNPSTLTSDLRVDLNESEKSKALALKEDDTVSFTCVLKKWGTLIDVSADHGTIL